MRTCLIALALWGVACTPPPPEEEEPIGGGRPSYLSDAGVEHFHRPWAGEFPVSNFFDHDVPREFVDSNGRMMTFWGESTPFLDGHDGYDVVMPEGTELKAVAAGTVLFAGTESPFFCPTLGATVAGKYVRLQTTAPDGTTFRPYYVHMSRIDVTAGQKVTAGQVLGLSGNTGCSTGPHLHFAVHRMVGTRPVLVDPYGWQPSTVDPWTLDGGTASRNLWLPGEAPELYREWNLAPNPSPTDSAAVAITRLRYMGVDDPHHVENEFVELTLDPRFSSFTNLSGFSLQTHEGVSVPLPAVALTPQAPTVRVHVGVGTDTATDLYMNRTAPLFVNGPSCVSLRYPGGGLYRFSYLSGTCP